MTGSLVCTNELELQEYLYTVLSQPMQRAGLSPQPEVLQSQHVVTRVQQLPPHW